MKNAHRRDRTVMANHHWTAAARPDPPASRHDGIALLAGASF
jgi:hypothetical protein